MTPTETETSLKFAAVGDLLIAGGTERPRDLAPAMASLRELLAGCDVGLANLECTLDVGQGRVSTEPRVFADEAAIRALPDTGVTVVTLANNHAFDGLLGGFRRVRDLLEEIGIAHFGAGEDLDEATRPAIVRANNVSLAFLAGVDESSGPSHLAGKGQFGVAPMDVDRLCAQSAELAGEVDHVIVSLHWGRERYDIPSPRQIAQARRIVDAGASMILGHHPHVLQGWETHAGRPIFYSMGNVLVCDVPFTTGEVITWNRTERAACLLRAKLTPRARASQSPPEPQRPAEAGLSAVEILPTYDTGREILFGPTAPPHSHRRLERVNRLLAGGVSDRDWDRETFRVETLRPILTRLTPRGLLSLRPRHFRKAWRKLTGR